MAPMPDIDLASAPKLPYLFQQPYMNWLLGTWHLPGTVDNLMFGTKKPMFMQI